MSVGVAPLVGERFALRPGDPDATELTLVETAPSEAADPPAAGARRAFSIVFRGPLAPVLPQRIYPMRHDQLGAFELFIVPIRPDDQGMYEAVFT